MGVSWGRLNPYQSSAGSWLLSRKYTHSFPHCRLTLTGLVNSCSCWVVSGCGPYPHFLTASCYTPPARWSPEELPGASFCCTNLSLWPQLMGPVNADEGRPTRAKKQTHKASPGRCWWSCHLSHPLLQCKGVQVTFNAGLRVPKAQQNPSLKF